MAARSILRHTMATLANAPAKITTTPEGAVAISYKTLVNEPLSLTASIGEFPTLVNHSPIPKLTNLEIDM